MSSKGQYAYITRLVIYNLGFYYWNFENFQFCHIAMSIIRLEKLLKIDSGNALKKIIRRAQDMDDLTTILRTIIPNEARSHLLAVNLRENGELVLICSSPSWAARLRFESEQLIQAVRMTGADVSSCKVRVSSSTGNV